MVDLPTYQRYQQIEDPKIRSEILYQIKPRGGNNPASFAVIQSDEKQRCPFLSTSGWCDIQSALGQEYLSMTCATFPRLTNMVGSTIELSLTPSCPEAARKILLPKQPMVFRKFESDTNTPKALSKMIQPGLTSEELSYYFFELRELTFAILQNRSLPISHRLIVLGLLMNRLRNECYQSEEKNFESILHRFSMLHNSPTIEQEIDELPSIPSLPLALLSYLNEFELIHPKLRDRFLIRYDLGMQGLGYSPGMDFKELVNNYCQGLEVLASFERENGHIFENYLVNRVFSSLFPFGSCEDFYDEYLLLIVLFALIRIPLVGLARHQGHLEPEEVVSFIQCFSKEFEHSEAKLLLLVEILKENGFSSMAHLAALVRTGSERAAGSRVVE